jgi:hypothetical protein
LTIPTQQKTFISTWRIVIHGNALRVCAALVLQAITIDCRISSVETMLLQKRAAPQAQSLNSSRPAHDEPRVRATAAFGLYQAAKQAGAAPELSLNNLPLSPVDEADSRS